MDTINNAACALFIAIVLALILFWATDADARNVGRMTALINGPTPTNQYFDEDVSLSGHHGWSFDLDLSRGNDTSHADPASTSRVAYSLRYTIPFGGRDRSDRTCEFTWADTGRIVATAAVWAVSNRMIRGNSQFTAPGGPTLWGHAVKWSFAAAVHDKLTPGQAAAHIAADIAAEQIAGWSESLDIGLSSRLRETHHAYNPGSRWEDQIGMSGHLYRANALSMAMLKQRHGELDGWLIAAPAIGGAGYQLGRELHDRGVTAGWETDTLQNQMFGSRPYIAGELVQGAAMGVDVSRTLQCGQ